MVHQFIGGLQCFSMCTWLSMDTHTHFDLIFSQGEVRLSCCWYDARCQGQTHGPYIGDDLFSHFLDFVKLCTGFRFGTSDFMNKNGSCDSSSAGGPGGVFHCHVVIDYDIVHLEIIRFRHFLGHFKVHDVSGVVLHDEQCTLGPCRCLDCFIDLVWSRGCEHSTCYSAIKHTLSYKPSMRWFMSRTSTTDKGYLVLHWGILSHKNLKSIQLSHMVRMSINHTHQ